MSYKLNMKVVWNMGVYMVYGIWIMSVMTILDNHLIKIQRIEYNNIDKQCRKV